MSVARRPLLTATAAGTLLCALWFVPNANATGESGRSDAVQSSVSDDQDEGRLAETGGPVNRAWAAGSGSRPCRRTSWYAR
ncbi:hypothetical protein [Streptomyces sp. NPDC003943]